MALGDSTDPVLVKQNDTRPAITYQALQGNGNPVVLTGATIVFSMRNAQNQAVKVNRANATVVNATLGTMQWTPAAGSFDTNGTFEGEFEVLFSDGGIQTFPPGQRYIYILVGDDVA
jgi:hypothetical protein